MVSRINLLNIFNFFQFGLSLDKTISDAMRQNTDLHQDRCFLEENKAMMPTNEPALFFVMNFKEEK